MKAVGSSMGNLVGRHPEEARKNIPSMMHDLAEEKQRGLPVENLEVRFD
jgi:hypothetical protein